MGPRGAPLPLAGSSTPAWKTPGRWRRNGGRAEPLRARSPSASLTGKATPFGATPLSEAARAARAPGSGALAALGSASARRDRRTPAAQRTPRLSAPRVSATPSTFATAAATTQRRLPPTRESPSVRYLTPVRGILPDLAKYLDEKIQQGLQTMQKQVDEMEQRQQYAKVLDFMEANPNSVTPALAKAKPTPPDALGGRANPIELWDASPAPDVRAGGSHAASGSPVPQELINRLSQVAVDTRAKARLREQREAEVAKQEAQLARHTASREAAQSRREAAALEAIFPAAAAARDGREPPQTEPADTRAGALVARPAGTARTTAATRGAGHAAADEVGDSGGLAVSEGGPAPSRQDSGYGAVLDEGGDEGEGMEEDEGGEAWEGDPGMRPLTPAEEETVHDALDRGAFPRTEVLAEHEGENLEVKRSDFETLQHGAWLNDEVINVYLRLIKDRQMSDAEGGDGALPRVHLFSTLFYAKLVNGGVYNYKGVSRWTRQKRLRSSGLPGDCVLGNDLIIVPLHQSVHWTLAAIDMRAKRITFYDPVHRDDILRALTHLQTWLQDESQDKLKTDFDFDGWEFIERPQDEGEHVPSQLNGYDCGVFMCIFANYLAREEKFAFEQSDMSYFRHRMVADIIRGRVD